MNLFERMKLKAMLRHCNYELAATVLKQQYYEEGKNTDLNRLIDTLTENPNFENALKIIEYNDLFVFYFTESCHDGLYVRKPRTDPKTGTSAAAMAGAAGKAGDPAGQREMAHAAQPGDTDQGLEPEVPGGNQGEGHGDIGGKKTDISSAAELVEARFAELEASVARESRALAGRSAGETAKLKASRPAPDRHNVSLSGEGAPSASAASGTVPRAAKPPAPGRPGGKAASSATSPAAPGPAGEDHKRAAEDHKRTAKDPSKDTARESSFKDSIKESLKKLVKEAAGDSLQPAPPVPPVPQEPPAGGLPLADGAELPAGDEPIDPERSKFRNVISTLLIDIEEMKRQREEYQQLIFQNDPNAVKYKRWVVTLDEAIEEFTGAVKLLNRIRKT